MENILEDERFLSILKDPRYKKMPIKEKKTKIDKRFQAMFKDKNFKLKYTLDKRGRPVNHTSLEDLKKFYDLSSESSEDEYDRQRLSEGSEDKSADGDVHKDVNLVPSLEMERKVDLKHIGIAKDTTSFSESREHLTNVLGYVSSKKARTKDKKKAVEKSDSLGNDSVISADKEDKADSDFKDTVTFQESSDTSSSSESDVEPDILDGFDHKWEELDADAPVAAEITNRLALCNMDWDRIRAEDIMAVFNSFIPPGGVIQSVKVYPSEFGMERMEEEKLHGPKELVSETTDVSEENKESSRYHREKLRQYQINRLRYYYAVIECDSQKTASSLYDQLNGMEYESSSICMDLRYIPDDVTFEQEPKSVGLPAVDPSEYRPRLFVNSALQQVKVNLTWDETDPKRRETIRKAFREPESIEKDIKNYLASSSSESGEDSDDVPDDMNFSDKQQSDRKVKMEERIANYKVLLQSLEEKEKENDGEKYEMEITWEPGLKEKTEEVVKEKMQVLLTPFEEKLKKSKDERKQKKKECKKHLKRDEGGSASEESGVSSDEIKTYAGAKRRDQSKGNVDENMVNELSMLMGEAGNHEIDERSDNKNKKKRKMQKLQSKAYDNFEVDLNDARFSAIYSSHLYNIDPSDPHYKETKGMQAIVQEKQRKRKHMSSTEVDEITGHGLKKNYLSKDSAALLHSIKNKAKKHKLYNK